MNDRKKVSKGAGKAKSKHAYDVKSRLHPRSKHRGRYDFEELIEVCKSLEPFVALNRYGDPSIDFADPLAVKTLNTALLMKHYELQFWDIPAGYLCPPIPGRADYVHHMADVLSLSTGGQIPKGANVRCLDIGVGANCIYPIVAFSEYGWSSVGGDVDAKALQAAQAILDGNPKLSEHVSLRKQAKAKDIFFGIIETDEQFDLTVCNPPFHASMEEARAGSLRKVRNLGAKKTKAPVLNFGGQPSELWCEGGEKQFVAQMVRESERFSTSCFWFSTLVSKEAHVAGIQTALKRVGALEVKVIPMGQGNKTSRLVAWTFLKRHEQEKWISERWNMAIDVVND